MNLLRDAPLWAQLLLAALLLLAAGQDIAQRRISNLLCLGVIVAALAAAAAAAAGPSLALWQNLALFALLIVVSLPAFAKGWLGGGDVKLLAAVGLWADFAAAPGLLAAIFIAGGIIAALSLAFRRKPLDKAAKGVPYGVAIAVGTGILLSAPALHPPRRAAPSPLDLGDARIHLARP